MGHAGDDPRGRLVRPYAVTRGRTEPASSIAIEAVLQTSERGVWEAKFEERERRRIAAMCADRPQSLAEIAVYLGQPLGVARVLVADMVASGLLVLHAPEEESSLNDRIDVLERVLVGLHRL